MHECSVSHTPMLLVETNPQSGGKNPIPEEEVEKASKKMNKSPHKRKLVIKSCLSPDATDM